MEKISIFSPHIDDAFLSLGGNIIAWKNKGIEVTVNNIFTITPWVNPDAFAGSTSESNVMQVSRLRQIEEENVSSHVGYNTNFWAFPDLPLRENFTPEETQDMCERIYRRMESSVSTGESLFFPIGVDHPDHILITKLGKRLLRKGHRLYFYEDMPYVSWGRLTMSEGHELHNLEKTPIIANINVKDKSEILRLYKSQVTESWLRCMEAYAYCLTDNKSYERYWAAEHRSI